MNKIKLFLSHSIRGQQGNDATLVQMRKNVNKAVEWALYLREALPEAEIYCPGEHEGLFADAWWAEMIDSDQILRQSKAIVRLCDAVLLMPGTENSEGAFIECIEARKHNVGIISFCNAEPENWADRIREFIELNRK